MPDNRQQGDHSGPPIEFGTDGWRAVIAREFTFDSVRRVTSAIALAIRELSPPEGVDREAVVVGFDRRFLSKEFADLAAQTLAEAGLRVVLSDGPTPSQTVSHAVHARKFVAGVIVTASHNPAIWNGLKVKGWYGGSALPEVYESVTRHLDRPSARSGGVIESADILNGYVTDLANRVDVAKIRDAKLRVLHDPIHGAASGIPSRVLGVGVDVTTIRGEVNPAFGGVNPEPIPKNLVLTTQIMEREALSSGHAFDLAICNDGDADRLGILDEGGRFISPHRIISLLVLYLVREKGLRGDIIKTFSTTRLVEKIARKLDVVLHETPIGFKYVADIMLSRPVLIGGEESGGIAFGSFLPERDGILSGLLVAEAIAHYGTSLSEILVEMEREFGSLFYDRVDLHLDRASVDLLIDRVGRGELDSAFGDDFSHREATDGIKLNFRDGTWLLFRRSGTEPMIRLYCESPDRARVGELLDRAAQCTSSCVKSGSREVGVRS